MTRKRSLEIAIFSLFLVLVCFFISAACEVTNKSSSGTIKLSDVPFRMPEIKPPVFPDRTFDITEFGAAGDGKTKNTD